MMKSCPGPVLLPLLLIAAPGCDTPKLADGLPLNPDCSSCHGSAKNAAPPLSVWGRSTSQDLEVGAHQSHLRDSTLRAAIACSECHIVPRAVDEEGHIPRATPDHPAGPARIVFGPLASAQGVKATWDRAAGTCSVYCHGVTLKGGLAQSPRWTKVDGTQKTCDSCHGNPPPVPHPKAKTCSGCHEGTVKPDGAIDLAGGLHIDGKVDLKGSGDCGACHGVPPEIGSHLAHYGDSVSAPLAAYGDLRLLRDFYPAGKPYYMFGCGNCHPLDPTKHMNGKTEVELYDPSATPGTLKARNPQTAAYAGGVCSNVYCHSTGQASPLHKDSPAWSSGKTTCSSCHDNPPRYPSGGAGSLTANTHLVLADDGHVLGHFAGLPGTWHMTPNSHGGADRTAAPITCQTCHFKSVDETSTGASKFFWLDTTGSYSLPGAIGSFECASCHTGGTGKPAAKAGKAAPLRHVNGVRDVEFDQRTTLPPYPGAPQGANFPSRPYWVSPANITTFPPTIDAGFNGVTWSVHLKKATYDSTSKTCSNVACHLKQTSVKWGQTPVGWATCNLCHQF